MNKYSSEMTKMNFLQSINCLMGMCMCFRSTFQKVVRIQVNLTKIYLNHSGIQRGFFVNSNNQFMSEKSYRSVVKSISWRTIGTIDTIIISFLITGKATLALSTGGVEVFTKMALYYFHERTWNRIYFGRIKKSDSDYQR